MHSGASGVACLDTSFCRFCHARSRVPIVFGPFHYCASCERAAPDAPETIDDQWRSTRCRYRTIYGGSRGSASLPAPAKWLGPSTPTVYTNDSTLTETKAFVSVSKLRNLGLTSQQRGEAPAPPTRRQRCYKNLRLAALVARRAGILGRTALY